MTTIIVIYLLIGAFLTACGFTAIQEAYKGNVVSEQAGELAKIFADLYARRSKFVANTTVAFVAIMAILIWPVGLRINLKK